MRPFDLEVWLRRAGGRARLERLGQVALPAAARRRRHRPGPEHRPVDELGDAVRSPTRVARLGARVRPGWFAQTHEHPELRGRTLLDILHRGDDHRDGMPSGAGESRARPLRARPGRPSRPSSTLSGGQQARFQILLLELSGATLLLLDEPTDNLDLVSAEALEDGLDAFEGTVLAVTHDRWFARAFDRFLVFGADGAGLRGRRAGLGRGPGRPRPLTWPRSLLTLRPRTGSLMVVVPRASAHARERLRGRRHAGPRRHRLTTDATKATTVRTYTPKPADVQRQWHVIDATDVVLGRLATQAATLLRGKHKPIFAPHVDTGDFVIIINAGKVALTGNKREQKMAYRHSGYPGGLSAVTYAELLDKHPERAVEKAIRGMLPQEHPRSAAARASSRSTPARTTRTRRSSRSRSRSPRSPSRPAHRCRPSTHRRRLREPSDARYQSTRARRRRDRDQRRDRAMTLPTSTPRAATAPARPSPPRGSSPPPARPPAAARRPSPASGSSRAPASGRSTAARWRSTSRTRCTSSSSTSRSRPSTLDGRLRRHRPHPRRRHLRPGRRAAPRHRPRAQRDRRRGQPSGAQEGRLPHP